ncbi:mCG1046321, partial [Mus musculus]
AQSLSFFQSQCGELELNLIPLQFKGEHQRCTGITQMFFMNKYPSRNKCPDS